MQRRKFVTGAGALLASPVLYGVSTLAPDNSANANDQLPQRWETALAIYEKNSAGSWITLKRGTSMAAMTREVDELELPFNVLAKNNGEFVLDRVKVSNGLDQLHNRPFSPARLYV